MTLDRKQLIRDSWRLVEPNATALAAFFYDKLFELDPGARELFATTDMAAQGEKVMRMFGEIVRAMDDPERYVTELAALGRRHAAYGARSDDYTSVGVALLWMLERALGPKFTRDVSDAWSEAYRTMSTVMQRAALREAGSTAPGAKA